MVANLPPHPVVTVLIQEAPTIEIDDEMVFVTDHVDGQPTIRRAMRRSVAVRTFAGFAEALRKDRLSKCADILPFRPELIESA
jgi:dihydroxyacetone kinase